MVGRLLLLYILFLFKGLNKSDRYIISIQYVKELGVIPILSSILFGLTIIYNKSSSNINQKN